MAHTVKSFITPPLKVPKIGTPQEKTIALLTQMNQHIEAWIRDHPEQWFWVHRRWPKPLYQKKDPTHDT